VFSDKVIASFWKRVTKRDDGCWIYVSNSTRYSFLSCRANGKRYLAHRFSYELHHNTSIPDGMLVCHQCDVPKCVNPAHLFLGTNLDNNRDRDQKGRNHHSSKTTCKHGHALSADNYYIQARTGWRYCLQCRRDNDKKRARKKLGTKANKNYAKKQRDLYLKNRTKRIADAKRRYLLKKEQQGGILRSP
jgi:hypothetical protein